MTGEKYRVLIVDDDKFLLDIYSLKFKQEGLSVETAVSGEDALAKLKSSNPKFNILLLDMVMPEMDGLTLLALMKKENLEKDIVRIILTNQGQQEDIKKAEEFGIDGYIVKATSIPSEVLAEVIGIADKKFKL